MNSSKNGISTFSSSVTNIEKFGFWMIIENREYFIAFKDYPHFNKATIEEIFDFKMTSKNQLHWKKLDIDIELEALEKPHLFPLIYK
jgi:Protein of unknown function (DUF2442)